MLGGMGGGGPPTDSPTPDSGEQIYISSLALLKMLKHGELRQVPAECPTTCVHREPLRDRHAWKWQETACTYPDSTHY